MVENGFERFCELFVSVSKDVKIKTLKTDILIYFTIENNKKVILESTMFIYSHIFTLCTINKHHFHLSQSSEISQPSNPKECQNTFWQILGLYSGQD